MLVKNADQTPRKSEISQILEGNLFVKLIVVKNGSGTVVVVSFCEFFVSLLYLRVTTKVGLSMNKSQVDGVKDERGRRLLTHDHLHELSQLHQRLERAQLRLNVRLIAGQIEPQIVSEHL